MYFSSPARMRLAFGPGRAVLILGPAMRVLVDIGILQKKWLVVSGWPSASVFSGRFSEPQSGLRPERNFHREDSTSRFRTGWDEPARAALPGGVAGNTVDAASIRASAS